MRRSADRAAELSFVGGHRFRDDHMSDDWTLTSAAVLDTSVPSGDARLVGRLNWPETWTKVVGVVFFLLTLSCSGYPQVVTAVEGESWLEHLHRSFDETSMGKSSGVYGPAAPMPSEWPLPHPALKLSNKFTEQGTTLYGSDLYRLKCQ